MKIMHRMMNGVTAETARICTCSGTLAMVIIRAAIIATRKISSKSIAVLILVLNLLSAPFLAVALFPVTNNHISESLNIFPAL
jgi:hypothetical protein